MEEYFRVSWKTNPKNTLPKLYGVNFFKGGDEHRLVSFLVCTFLYIQFITVLLWIYFTDSDFFSSPIISSLEVDHKYDFRILKIKLAGV